MKKHWYDYLWIFSALYLTLGFFNILFAWLGMICFITPLLISIFSGSKAYCNRYCGRGQLFQLLGDTCGLSRKKKYPLLASDQLVPIWFSYIFYGNVYEYDFSHLVSFSKNPEFKAGGDTALDL